MLLGDEEEANQKELPPMLSVEEDETTKEDLESNRRVVVKVETLLAAQGFGSTLKTPGADAAIVERVSELLLRFAERGARNQELAMRCERLEREALAREAPAPPQLQTVTDHREADELRRKVRSLEAEVSRERSANRKLRDEVSEAAKVASKAKLDAAQSERELLLVKATTSDDSSSVLEAERERSAARKLRDELAEATKALAKARAEAAKSERELRHLERKKVPGATATPASPSSLSKPAPASPRYEAETRRLQNELAETQKQLAKMKLTARQNAANQESSMEKERAANRKLRDELQEAKENLKSTRREVVEFERRMKNFELREKDVPAPTLSGDDAFEAELTKERNTARKLRGQIAELKKDLQVAHAKVAHSEREYEKLQRQASPAKTQEKKIDPAVERDAGAIFEAAYGRKPQHGRAFDDRALNIAEIGVKRRLQLEHAVAALQDEVALHARKAAQQQQQQLKDKENMDDSRKAELEALRRRPTHRELKECQLKIAELEDRLGEKVQAERAYRKYAGTAALVARDKLDFSLKLRDVDRLPRAFLADVVKCLCRALKLGDVSQLEDGVGSLIKATASIPVLERFAADVLDLVADDDSVASSRSSPAECLDVLRKWRRNLATGADLRKFRASVAERLVRAGRLGPGHETTDVSLALDDVFRDLAANKDKRDLYAKADALLSDDPQSVVAHVLKHLADLFHIPNLDGFIPHFTLLRRRLSELDTFRSAVAAALGLPPVMNASLPAILKAIAALTPPPGGAGLDTASLHDDDDIQDDDDPPAFSSSPAAAEEEELLYARESQGEL